MSQKSPILASHATTNAAQDSLTANIDNCFYHHLYLEWVPGVSGNVLTVKIFTRHDGSGQWTQEQDWANTSGTKTVTLAQFQYTSAGTTVVPLLLPLNNVQGKDMKFTYLESDAGGAGKGTLVGNLYSFRP